LRAALATFAIDLLVARPALAGRPSSSAIACVIRADHAQMVASVVGVVAPVI